MDRLTSMAIFVVAVDAGSLSAAARRFGLSASMAGKHVAAIEAELGTRLLQRSTRRLALTQIGEAYHARCRQLLEAYDDAKREATDATESVRGVLRVAAPVTFGAMHLSEPVARYLREHPNVSVEVQLDDRYIDLVAERVDVAIRIGKLADSELIARRLAPCRMVFCASPRFIAAHGPLSRVDALQRAPRLIFNQAVSGGDWAVVDAKGKTHVIDGPVRLGANNTEMLLAAALAGTGVAYGPSFVFGASIRSGELVVLLPRMGTAELSIHAVYPSVRNVPAKLRRFLATLTESFAGEPPWDR